MKLIKIQNRTGLIRRPMVRISKTIGARILAPFIVRYGSRFGSTSDPSGHIWSYGTGYQNYSSYRNFLISIYLLEHFFAKDPYPNKKKDLLEPKPEQKGRQGDIT